MDSALDLNEEERLLALKANSQSSADQDEVRRLSFPEQGQRPNSIVDDKQRVKTQVKFRAVLSVPVEIMNM